MHYTMNSGSTVTGTVAVEATVHLPRPNAINGVRPCSKHRSTRFFRNFNSTNPILRDSKLNYSIHAFDFNKIKPKTRNR